MDHVLLCSLAAPTSDIQNKLSSPLPQPPKTIAHYRPDIDGLRAIAVLFVIGFHAFPSIFRGGFSGVDIFFVISGFLITSIILDEVSVDRFTVLSFYQRRIRRIFPALLTVLLACLAAGWFLLNADEYSALGKHIAAGAFFVANLVQANEEGYFDVSSDTKPLLHLWSLGVEEQFYIFFPLLVSFLLRFRRSICTPVLVLALVSLFLSGSAVLGPTLNFYSPMTRAWQLLLGALLASCTGIKGEMSRISDGGSVFARNFLSALGVVGLLLSIWALHRDETIPGVWSLLPTISAAILIVAGKSALLNRLLLSNPQLVALGLISYPLYLWHWPLLTFSAILHDGRPSVLERCLILIVSTALAWLTYRYVEQPLRYGRFRREKIAMLVVAMLLVGITGIVVLIDHGVPDRKIALTLQSISEATVDFDYSTGLVPSTYNGIDVLVTSEGKPKIFFWGDSHIEQFIPRIRMLTAAGQLPPAIVLTGGGCPPIFGIGDATLPKCETLHLTAEQVLKANGSIATVVLGGCWACYFINEVKPQSRTNSRFNYYYQDAGSKHYLRAQDGAERALQQLEMTLRALTSKYKVVLLLDNPSDDAADPRNLLDGRFSGNTLSSIAESFELSRDQLALNERLKNIALRSGVGIIDQISALCTNGRCPRLNKDRKPIYKDSHHFRPFFVRESINYFDSQLIKK